jgi:16S rRNA (adenine1518-N6/adenine1519-N6)-dimethyltransferase
VTKTRAKKSYGQHFLINTLICQDIVEGCLSKCQGTNILEVGPGKGALTDQLINRGKRVISVEADPDMYEYAKNRFEGIPGIEIIYRDFLKANLAEFFEGEEFALIGNFPYNISSQILFRLLENKERIGCLVGMFQKEVADRIVSGHGNKSYGVLSVLTQAYYDAEYLFTVDRSEFIPRPKVQSGVIRLIRKESQELPCSEKTLRKVVKAAFQQRRKMFRNSLKGIADNFDFLEDKYLTKRPEQVSIQEFIEISAKLEETESTK